MNVCDEPLGEGGGGGGEEGGGGGRMRGPGLLEDLAFLFL